jgi:hypothetical protein
MRVKVFQATGSADIQALQQAMSVWAEHQPDVRFVTSALGERPDVDPLKPSRPHYVVSVWYQPTAGRKRVRAR